MGGRREAAECKQTEQVNQLEAQGVMLTEAQNLNKKQTIVLKKLKAQLVKTKKEKNSSDKRNDEMEKKLSQEKSLWETERTRLEKDIAANSKVERSEWEKERVKLESDYKQQIGKLEKSSNEMRIMLKTKSEELLERATRVSRLESTVDSIQNQLIEAKAQVVTVAPPKLLISDLYSVDALAEPIFETCSSSRATTPGAIPASLMDLPRSNDMDQLRLKYNKMKRQARELQKRHQKDVSEIKRLSKEVEALKKV